MEFTKTESIQNELSLRYDKNSTFLHRSTSTAKKFRHLNRLSDTSDNASPGLMRKSDHKRRSNQLSVKLHETLDNQHHAKHLSQSMKDRNPLMIESGEQEALKEV